MKAEHHFIVEKQHWESLFWHMVSFLYYKKERQQIVIIYTNTTTFQK